MSTPTPALFAPVQTGRSVVMAANGMIATAHPLASAAGLRILMEGGNAVDAAIAAAAVTWVTMPMMCGPGGDAFMIIYDAKSGKSTAINGSGIVGSRATIDYLAAKGFRQIMPQVGTLSAAIPGAVDAFEEAMCRFGTRTWEDLLQDAIHHALAHPLHEACAKDFAANKSKLAQFPTTAAIYLQNGEPPKAGDILRQPEYAESLRKIAKGGAEVFYRGELGAHIAAAAEAHGLFDGEELAAHRSVVGEPIRIPYRGDEILSTAPPSQGMIHLEAQHIVSQFDLQSLPPADAMHVLIEANKIATADRLRWAGDPRFVNTPLDALLSAAYARRRAAEIQQDRCLPLAAAGDPHGDTTYLCAVDRHGNTVSLIHSLSNAFGSGEIIAGTGLFLNNRAGRGFTLTEGHPNCIAPGKRTMHTLNCYTVMKDGRPYLVGGTPGGDGQPQWNLQVLCYILDWGLNVQQACEAPRWSRLPATDPIQAATAPTVKLDGRFSAAVVTGLEAKGHPVSLLAPWSDGGAVQLIQIDHVRGALHGGSDPRADGAVMGF